MKYRIVLLIIALGLMMATGAQAALEANFNFWNINASSVKYMDVYTHGGTPGDGMNFQAGLIAPTARHAPRESTIRGT